MSHWFKRFKTSLSLSSSSIKESAEANMEEETDGNQRLNIQELPKEIVIEIFSYLPFSNILSLMTTSKTFCQFSNDPLYWRIIYVSTM